MRKSVTIPLTLPKELLRDLDTICRKEDFNRSQLIRKTKFKTQLTRLMMIAPKNALQKPATWKAGTMCETSSKSSALISNMKSPIVICAFNGDESCTHAGVGLASGGAGLKRDPQ